MLADPGEIEVGYMDRLNAPNDEAGRAALEAFLRGAFPGASLSAPTGDLRGPLSVIVRLAS